MTLPYGLNRKVRLVFETPVDRSHFFGYYTHSPLSADSRYLLAHRLGFDARPINENDRTEVGYFDILTGKWETIGETRAFNWQQGSLLQWLGPDFQSKVIYNDQEDDSFIARIADISNGNKRSIPHAIYVLHPSGEHALSFRFERQYYCRAYHYAGVKDQKWNVPLHPDDGILSIDLKSGAAQLIVRTEDIAAIDPLPETAGAAHWLAHLLLNPSARRFMFLHRFGTSEIYTTRLFTADYDGSNLFCLPGYLTHSYTHMAWRDNQSFVIYTKKERPLSKVYSSLASSSNTFKSLPVKLYRSIKRFIPRDFTDRRVITSGYTLVQDGVSNSRLISTGMLREDGHPSWTKEGRFMLTDTYADEKGYRHLLLYDAVKNKVHRLGQFISPYNNCNFRCDLHPRFSPDEGYVIIDTAHSGRRQIFLLELDLNRFS